MPAAPYGYHYEGSKLVPDGSHVTWQPGTAGATPDSASNSGMPKYPTLNSLLDEGGNLKSQYQLQARPDVGYQSQIGELDKRLGGINLNTQGIEKVREYATGSGPSAWGKLMEENQRMGEQDRRNQNAASNASAQSGAFSQLASKGGLSSGARERLALQGSRSLNASQQDIARQGQEQRIGIGGQDEAQRLQLLSQLPGMEVQALQPDFQKASMWGNLANAEANKQSDLALSNRAYSTDVEKLNKLGALQENARLDQSNLGAYSEAMKAYAANQQAKATAASGSGGKK